MAYFGEEFGFTRTTPRLPEEIAAARTARAERVAAGQGRGVSINDYPELTNQAFATIGQWANQNSLGNFSLVNGVPYYKSNGLNYMGFAGIKRNNGQAATRHPAYRYLKAKAAMIRAARALNKWDMLPWQTQEYRLTGIPETQAQANRKAKNQIKSFMAKVQNPNYDPATKIANIQNFSNNLINSVNRVAEARTNGYGAFGSQFQGQTVGGSQFVPRYSYRGPTVVPSPAGFGPAYNPAANMQMAEEEDDNLFEVPAPRGQSVRNASVGRTLPTNAGRGRSTVRQVRERTRSGSRTRNA